MTPEIADLVLRHRLRDPRPHTDLQPDRCRCSEAPAGLDGPVCPNCGGMTRRTGTCATCIECGATTGCG